MRYTGAVSRHPPTINDMKNPLIIVGLVFALLLPVCSLRAETLRVVAEHWPPYVDESLPQNGLAIDLVTTAFSRARYDVTIDYEAWPRALEGVKIGVYDVVANIWHSDERARDLDYSDAYLINDIRFIKRKESSVKFSRMSDLDGLMVGVEKDYAYPKAFADASSMVKISNNGLLPALNELVQGRYDLVIGDLNAINFVLMKFLSNEAKGLEILPKSVGMSKLYIAVSKANPKHAKIVKDFNQALRSMQKDGTYQAIINAHRQQP